MIENLFTYLLQLRVEILAVRWILAARQWVHDLIHTLRICVWRTGAPCACPS